ncbi:hypothetical protein FRC02_000479 [Tulasnella sp. 418]|nr:hypothetical protein FRC02_000479 [Tulasnella sp. 418]
MQDMQCHFSTTTGEKMGYYIVLTLEESECRHFPGRAFVRHSTGLLRASRSRELGKFTSGTQSDHVDLQSVMLHSSSLFKRTYYTAYHSALRLRHADVIINGSRRKISFDLPLQWGQCRGFSDILLRCVRNKVQNRRDLWE